jgi:hypothetical protein
VSSPEPGTVLAYWHEHREQLRQSETQRSVLTNYLLVITAGLSGFIVAQHFAMRTLAVAVLVVGIGLYGALTTAKYHERAAYHLGQARALTDTLKGGGVLTEDENLTRYRDEHYQAYPTLHRVRLHRLWTGLHLGIALYGAVLFVVILLIG